MNCANCGAAMRFVTGRGHFACDYCATFHFPDAPSNGESVRLMQAAAEQACPGCHQSLRQAVIEDQAALACGECRGVLIAQIAFAELVTRYRQQAAAGPERAPTPINVEDLHRVTRCPSCDCVMETHPYYGPGAVVIDTCASCGLIWFDHGELAVIEQALAVRR